MIIFKRAADLGLYISRQKQKGSRVGFAPTMGALHAGHRSLVEASAAENEITVSSIFVNPTQFNDPNDFKKYPVTLEKDIDLLESAGCSLLFLPPVEEIYPDGITAGQHYDLGFIETVLEGPTRPGHFQGVCRVVHRLLDIVQPDWLYLGQKDYQQCMVIRKMTELTGLDQTIQLRICPTLREPNGLAMSSRNMRLSPQEREKAAVIYRTLLYIRQQLRAGSLTGLKATAAAMLTGAGLRPDYVEIAAAHTLELLDEWDGAAKTTALIAAFMGEVRLIDNLELN